MTKKRWQTRIKKAMVAIGTYKPPYDDVIKTLAAILEKRDLMLEAYDEAEDGPVIEYVNKSGKANTVKNPLLVMWSDLNTQALSYWRDLGLTPAGLKKLNGDLLGDNTVSDPIAEFLSMREK